MTAQASLNFIPRYFNTTGLRGGVLRDARSAARRQDDVVLALMRRMGRATPSQVWEAGQANGSDWLLTSVRRSINTLTSAGKLRKTAGQRMGPYGRPEGLWETA